MGSTLANFIAISLIEGNFFKRIEESWSIKSCSSGKSKVCAEKCGTGFDAFGDQWK